MSKHFRNHGTRLILVTIIALFFFAAAEAAPIKKIKLKPSDVKSAVEKALAAIPGARLKLDKIEGIHQHTSRNQKGKDELLNNTATIYAVVSGTVNTAIPGGQAIVLDKDFELIHCSQLNDRRWICRFTLLSASSNPFLVEHFLLEK